jgi:hypothetical protein
MIMLTAWILGDLRRIVFYDNEYFAINSMSYNFQVLLGWVDEQFPITSERNMKIMFARMGKDAPSVYATSFAPQDIWAQQAWTKQWNTTEPPAGMAQQEQFIAPNIFMQPYYGGTYANRWTIQYAIKTWVGPWTPLVLSDASYVHDLKAFTNV